MGFRMKWLVLLCGVFLIAGAAFGGDLEPAAPPGSTSSYTMHDLYQRLLNGVQGSKKTFTGPAVWHDWGSGPMETVDDVMGVAPVKMAESKVYGQRKWNHYRQFDRFDLAEGSKLFRDKRLYNGIERLQ